MKKLFTAIQRMLDGLSSCICPLSLSYPGSQSFVPSTDRQPRDNREMSERQSGARVAREWLKYAAVFVMLLTVGIGNVWGGTATITEDFEKQTAGTTYNSTQSYTAANSNAGIAWFVEHGTVSTSSYLDDSKSMHMRAYYAKSSASGTWNGNLPYVNSTTDVKGLISITFNAAVSNTGLKMDVMYSTNSGSSWSYMYKTSASSGTNASAITFSNTSKASYTYYIPSAALSPTGNFRIKIAVNSSSTHASKPSSAGNYTFRVDNIAFTYTAYTVTYNGNGNTSGSVPADATKYLSGATVTVKSNSGSLAKTGYTFSGWNTQADGNGTNYTAGSGTFTITSDKTLYAEWIEDAPAYTIIAASNNNSYGTVSLAGSVITATPAACCEYASPAYTVSPVGNATVLQGTGANINKFTISSLTSDVTVTINFQEKAEGRTVNFDAGAGVCATTSLQEDCLGAGIILPSVTASSVCKGWTTFAGWATTEVTDSTTSSVTLYDAGAEFTPSSNGQTLYAVFSKNKSGGIAFQRYEKVESAPSDWSGKYLLSTGTYTATNYDNSHHLACSSLTPGSTEYSSYEFTLTKVADVGYSIKAPDDKYIGWSDGTAFVYKAEAPTKTETSYLWTPSTTEYIANVGTTGRQIAGNNSSTPSDFRPYSNPSTSSSAKVFLYKRIEGAGVTTYYCSDPNCCISLGSVNGSISENTPTSVTLTWDAVSGAEKYQVKVPGSTSHNNWTDVNTTSVTVTKSCGTGYTAYFRAIDTNGSHCAEGPESTLAIPAVSWTVTSTGITHATASPAIPSTTCSGFSTTVTAAAGYDLPSTITVSNASHTWNQATGALTVNSVTGNVSITITPTVYTYTITYYDGDAENASKAFSGEHEDGYPTTHTYATSTTLKSATKDGFNFGGWYDNKECEGDPITSLGATSYTADIVLYAKWIDDSKWTVTIGSHANGSLSVTYTGMESALTSGSREIEKNTVLTISATPNTGYTLTNLTVGDDDDFTSGGTHTLTGNITVSATFSAINYTITYNLNGGVNNGDNVASYTIEDEVLFEAPTKTGYHFDGWFTDAEFDPESEIMWIDEGSTGNVVVYAKWSANSYDVTLKPNGGTGSDQVVSATYDAAMPITVKTAGTDIVIPTREGYTFTGWWDATSGGNKYYKADGTSARTWNVAEATNLYAQWSINEYNVAVSAVGDVTISATSPSIDEGGNADVNYGSIVTLSYSGVTSGMYWGGWKVYKSDDESTTVTVTNNSFTMPAYNVVVSAILFSDLLAWCDPDVSVTGDIHLTSYKDIYVNSTSEADNLIEISSSDMGSATRMEVAYLDAEDNEVDKAESVFRLCNNGTPNYNVNDDAIALDYEWSSTHSVRYTPNAFNQRDNYKLQLTFKKGEQVLKTVEHNLYGRALPEEFVLAVKNTSDNHWYALPNTMGDNSDAQTAITPTRIFVDDPTTPTKATFASESTIYKGKARNTATGNVNGIRLSPDGTKILRIISGKNFLYLPSANSDANQVWYLKSTDFDAYEIAQDPSQNPSKKLGLYNNSGVYFGYATTPFSYNIYLLPIDDNGKYADLALTDIDWTDDDFGFTATTSATKAAVQIEDGTRTTLVDLHSEGNVHAANLNIKVDFTNKEGQNVLLTLYNNNGDILEGAQVTIPSIVTTTATAWGSIATEPTLDNIVVLKGDMVVSQKDAAAKSIVLDGGKLEIAAGAALVMDGNVKKFDGDLFRQTAVGDVALHSTKAAGTGALIMNPATVTVAPKATVEQATKTGKIDSDWINQHVGTPFSDGNSYNNWYGSYVYYYDAEGGSWVNVKRNTSDASLVPFRGYNVLRSDETTFWMQGTVNLPITDDVELSAVKNGGETTTENMFANSWLAPIDITAFADGDFVNINKVIYIFNAGTPAQWNAAGSHEGSSPAQWMALPIDAVKADASSFSYTVIPSMQGFKVLANAADAKLKLNYDKLVYQPALDLLDAGEDLPIKPNLAPEMRHSTDDKPEVLNLMVQGESGYGDRVLLFVRDDFTNGYDDGWEGSKMTGMSVAPQMYAVSDDGKMSIDAVPEAEGTVIGFRAGQDNNYTFTFRYEGNDVLYLNDMLTETSTRIHEGFSYDFTTADGDIETRFVISHTPFVKTTPTGMDNVQGDEGQSVRKLFYQGVMYIIRGGKIYNASGERVK